MVITFANFYILLGKNSQKSQSSGKRLPVSEVEEEEETGNLVLQGPGKAQVVVLHI